MHESDDTTDSETARIDQVLEESQRQERAELHAELARQVAADQRVVEALAKKHSS